MSSKNSVGYSLNWMDILKYFLITLHVSMMIPSPLGSGFKDVSILLAFILLLVNRQNPDWNKILNWQNVLYLILFGWLTASTLYFSGWNDGIYALRKAPGRGLFLYFTIFLLATSRNKSDTWFLTFLFSAFLTYLLAASYIPWFMGIEYNVPGKMQAFGLWFNTTARFINLLWPFVLSFALIYQKLLFKSTFFLIFLLSIIAIPLTLSRGGMITTAFQLIFFFGYITWYYKNRLNWKIIGILLSSAGICSGIVTYTWLNEVIKRFSRANWTTLSGRVNRIWPNSLELIKERPLLGHGFRTFTKLTRETFGRKWAHTHNFFLEFLFIGGIIGLLIFLGLMLFIILKLSRRSFQAKNILAWGALTSICGYLLLHGMITVLNFHWFSLLISTSWLSISHKEFAQNLEIAPAREINDA